MSRIQEILAKAEREGTTRRTHAATASDPAAAAGPAPFARADVASARDAGAFMRVSVVPEAEPRPVAPELPKTRTSTAALDHSLVAALAPHSTAAERYRAIRTRLTQREDHAPLRSLVVTSPGAGDGKSVTAANLALTMAQEFQRSVVLVDADLRTPVIHALFGVEAQPGLAEVLTGETTLDEALIYLPDYRLTILPAGGAPQFPTELLASTAMRRAIDTLRARFDRILLDVPAVAPLADTGAVAPLADGIVLVVRAGVTQRPALDQALASFEEHKVIGVVLNDAN